MPDPILSPNRRVRSALTGMACLVGLAAVAWVLWKYGGIGNMPG